MTEMKGKVHYYCGVSGLGLGLARRFIFNRHEGDYHLYAESVRDRRWPTLSTVGDRIHTLPLDVYRTDSAVAEAAIETDAVFGKIHVLCTNAGVNIIGTMDESSD